MFLLHFHLIENLLSIDHGGRTQPMCVSCVPVVCCDMRHTPIGIDCCTSPVSSCPEVFEPISSSPQQLMFRPVFRYASFQMALCAVPAVVIMNLGPHAVPAAAAATKLAYVWFGLALVMSFRALSIWAPYKLNLPPFNSLGPMANQDKQR